MSIRSDIAASTWTREDAHELDLYVRKVGTLLPLRRDECLYAAFAELRDVRKSRPDECLDCDRIMRPANTLASDYPNTVRHDGHGICAGCAKKRGKRQEVTHPDNPDTDRSKR